MTATLADAAVKALALNAFRRYDRENNTDHLSWRHFADEARADLQTLADVGALNIYLARSITPQVTA